MILLRIKGPFTLANRALIEDGLALIGTTSLAGVGMARTELATLLAQGILYYSVIARCLLSDGHSPGGLKYGCHELLGPVNILGGQPSGTPARIRVDK